MFSVGPSEMLLLMLVALLLYGGDLPKVARSWGKSLGEFKRGLARFQNEFDSVLYDYPPRRIPYHDPVYSQNAGTVEGELAENDPSHSPETAALGDETEKKTEDSSSGDATSVQP